MKQFEPVRVYFLIAEIVDGQESLHNGRRLEPEEFHAIEAFKARIGEIEQKAEGRSVVVTIEDLKTHDKVDLTMEGVRSFIQHNEEETVFRVYTLFEEEDDRTFIAETPDFAQVVGYFKADPFAVMVYRLDEEGNEQPYLMETHFTEVEEPLELPPQSKMAFTVAKPTTRPPTDDEDVNDDPIPILREMSKNVETMVELHWEHFRALGRHEDAVINKREKQGLSFGPNDGNPWYRHLLAAIQNTASTSVDMDGHYKDGAFGERTLGQEGRDWKQVLEHENVSLRPGAPRQKVTGSDSSAEELISYIGRKMGKTSPFEVPLYGSGFWVRFRAPSLEDFTELQYHLSELRVTVGSRTKGMAFSNMMQTMKSVVLDFVLQYVTDASVAFTTPSDLKDKIVVTDTDVLLWGLGTTIYPRGFPYSHSCVADPKKCNHIERAIIDLRWLLWTDELSLTQKQRKLMARKWAKTTSDEELKEYREEHRRGTNRIHWVNNFGLELKVPTLFEYEQSGKAWIEGLIESTKTLFNEPPHAAARNKYISVRAEATSACEYSHFVARVYERDEDDISADPTLLTENQEVIEGLLAQLFSATDVLEDVVKGITKFIDDSMISLIAVESYDCPSCGTPISEKFYERFPHLVALDVFTIFFILVNRKLNE